MTTPTVEQVDSWLPQTQCTQCGYPCCEAYAHAILQGEADINQCPPGGTTTISGLARLLETPEKPLNPKYGQTKPKILVSIDEDICIGCTLCIQACPVDAIVGAAKLMHTVVAADCTGCELCIPPCPVDCIDTYPAPSQKPGTSWIWADYSPAQTDRARTQTRARLLRLERNRRWRSLQKKHIALRQGGARAKIQQEIESAVSRSRARRNLPKL